MRVWKDKAGNELTEIPTFRLLDGKGRAVSKEAEARVAEVSGRAVETVTEPG
jgi:3-deoxy-D-manno-octulosonate 8-phosphate phosphatase KdsC-like HAD superfamily phosphatase